MKAMMISGALVLAMGCGKAEPTADLNAGGDQPLSKFEEIKATDKIAPSPKPGSLADNIRGKRIHFDGKWIQFNRDGTLRGSNKGKIAKYMVDGLKVTITDDKGKDITTSFIKPTINVGDKFIAVEGTKTGELTIVKVEEIGSEPDNEAKKPGTVLWEFEMGDDVSSSPAIGSDGTVYVGSWDNKLYAINGKTGVKLWEFETGAEVYSSPTIGSDGTVYVGSNDKKLYAINGKTGDKLWEFVTGGWVESSPGIGSDGTVYVGSYYKKLNAINPKTGGKLWEFVTRYQVFSSPAIGSDGTVYVGSADKKLYAIKTDSKGLAKSPWPMRGQNAQHTGRAPKK